jgi:predicted O-methyltransferase YrrM
MGDFTSDWFSSSINGIRRTLESRRPPKRILEIGSWEGRSACWFLETFPDSTITCVDTFEGSPEHHDMDVAGIKARFLKNTARFGDRVTIRQGHSSRELYGLEPESFDLVYVDGSHAEDDTLMDLILSFGLLRPGGVLLIDDYGGTAFPGVRRAVDKFAAAFHKKIQSVLCEYQVHFVKLSSSLNAS